MKQQRDVAAKDAAAHADTLSTRITELEGQLADAARTESDLATSDDDGRVAELEAMVAELKSALEASEVAPAAAAPAGSGGGHQGAIILQTIRSSLTQHKNRIDEDEQGWKDKEVAIGKGIQQLLSMVQKNPSSREMVYGLLNDLQGVLDTGRKLVKRNRQFVDEEEAAITEMEKNL